MGDLAGDTIASEEKTDPSAFSKLLKHYLADKRNNHTSHSASLRAKN